MMKKICMFFMAALLCAVVAFPVAASEVPDTEVMEISETSGVVVVDENHPARVIDEADLLSSSEEAELTEVLDEISTRQSFDLAVVTVNSTGGQDIISYTDDYYDYNGYGMGANFDGAMLLIDMGAREYYVSTCGYGIEALGDAELSYIFEQFQYDLSDGYYYDAFYTFAALSDEFVTSYHNGGVSEDGYYGYEDDYYGYEDDYYGYENDYYQDDSRGMGRITAILVILIICLAVGFLFAGIPMSRMKRQMRPVQLKAEAHDYLKPGSQKITKSRDAFLYNTVTRVPKPKQKSGGGGGSSFGGGVHMGSSGRSHGGMGGRF